MKRITITLLLAALLTGCGAAGKEDPIPPKPSAPTTQIANPWSGYETLAEAESAAGFAPGLPETVGDYRADTFRVMNGQMLEVVYRSGESEVTVRKITGEGQDISGVYTTYETVTLSDRDGASVKEMTDGTEVLTLVSADECSWSLFAPDGYADGAAVAFLSAVLGE